MLVNRSPSWLAFCKQACKTNKTNIEPCIKPLHRRVKPVKPIGYKKVKRLHIFLEPIGFIGFTHLCNGFMSGSISVLLVLHACQQNQPGCCRGGRSGQSLILCLTYRCVHPAQKLYENIMFSYSFCAGCTHLCARHKIKLLHHAIVSPTVVSWIAFNLGESRFCLCP